MLASDFLMMWVGFHCIRGVSLRENETNTTQNMKGRKEYRDTASARMATRLRVDVDIRLGSRRVPTSSESRSLDENRNVFKQTAPFCLMRIAHLT